MGFNFGRVTETANAVANGFARAAEKSHIMAIDDDGLTALVHIIAYNIGCLTECTIVTPVPQMITFMDDVDKDMDEESFITIIDLYAESIEKKIYDYLENYSAEIERIKAANIPQSSINIITEDMRNFRDLAITSVEVCSMVGSLPEDEDNFLRSIHNIPDEKLQSDLFNYFHHVMIDMIDRLIGWFEEIIDKSKAPNSVITRTFQTKQFDQKQQSDQTLSDNDDLIHVECKDPSLRYRSTNKCDDEQEISQDNSVITHHPQQQLYTQPPLPQYQPTIIPTSDQQQINLHPQPQPQISISAPTPRFEQVDFKDDELISKHIVANLWVMPEYVHQFKHMLHHMCETLDEVDAKAGRTEPSKFAFIIFHNTDYWMLQRIDKNGNSIPNTDKEYMAILMDPFYGITEPKMYFHNTQAEQAAS